MHILLAMFCMLLTFGGGKLVQDSWNSRKFFGVFLGLAVSAVGFQQLTEFGRSSVGTKLH